MSRFIITDDGIGFTPVPISELDEGRGWGLLTMQERAEAVGGKCRIESAPGQGTKIMVEIPR
jgi:signal transduction histidine kinase